MLHLAKRVYLSSNGGPEQHSKSLHDRQQTQVLLQVVPVVLHGPAKDIETFAMLDLGSTCSLIHSDVAEQLALEGPTETMVLNGILQRNSVLTKKVSFEVSPRDSPQRWMVEQAKTVDNLNLPNTKVDMSKEKSRWPHIADLPLPYIDASRVTVLLGADVFDLIVPQEIRTGPNGTPRAVRSALGWTAVSHLPSNHTGDHAMKVHIATPDEELWNQVQSWWQTESNPAANTPRRQRDQSRTSRRLRS